MEGCERVCVSDALCVAAIVYERERAMLTSNDVGKNSIRKPHTPVHFPPATSLAPSLFLSCVTMLCYILSRRSATLASPLPRYLILLILSMYLVRLSIYLSVYPSIYLSIYLSIHLSIHTRTFSLSLPQPPPNVKNTESSHCSYLSPAASTPVNTSSGEVLLDHLPFSLDPPVHSTISSSDGFLKRRDRLDSIRLRTLAIG